MSSAALEPTLPKPCTITRVLSRDRPSFWQASSQTIITPRPVASRRPREPPMLMGFPVTHVVTVCGPDLVYGADEFDQFGGVAAGHALDLAHGHLVRIADHAALGAAEGNVDHGALPGHPAGKGSNFIEGDVGSVADAAFGRTARDGMLHAEAREDLEVAVIHLHRDVDREFAVGITQNAPQALIKVELLGRQVKTRPLGLPGVAFLIHVRGRCDRRHRSGLRNDCRSGAAGSGRVPGRGGQTFRVYEGRWRGSKLKGR